MLGQGDERVLLPPVRLPLDTLLGGPLSSAIMTGPPARPSQQRTRVRISEGVYRDQWGIESKVQVGPHQRTKRWPAETSIKTMQRWRDEVRVSLQQLAASEARGPFADDVEAYLDTVQHLPTLAERTYIMGLWVAEFGTRTRASLTSAEVQAVLSRWLTEGLAVSTVAHRRSALAHCYRTLDGKDARNPARGTTLPSPPRPATRALDYATIERILDAMPDIGQGVSGAARGARSKTKARLRVMAYTGLPHKLLGQLRPEDVNLTAKTITVQPRRKGAGAEGAILPLTPRGVEAFKAFIAAEAWGPFSTDSMRASFLRACAHLGLVGVRPYDLRHSFGTAAYQATGDIAAVANLLTHADVRTTKRYTLGAEFARMKAATQALGEALAKIPVTVARGSTRRHAKRPA